MTLWFNDVCDLSCNTSVCDYDFYSCLNFNNATKYCYEYNDTTLAITDGNDLNHTDYTYFDYINDNITFDGSCETSWVEDNYCDCYVEIFWLIFA